MMRVSPPELARELPGLQASTSVTCAPIRKRWRAVQPPKAPAPTTTTFGFTGGAAIRFMAGRAADWRMERREVVLFIRFLGDLGLFVWLPVIRSRNPSSSTLLYSGFITQPACAPVIMAYSFRIES